MNDGPGEKIMTARDAASKGVERQISLPFSKAFEIAWKGLMVRLWRSLITMGGIVLAIAFLVSMWTNQEIVKALKAVPESDPSKEALDTAMKGQFSNSEKRSIRTGVLAGPGNEVREAIQNKLVSAAEYNFVLLGDNVSDISRAIQSDIDVLIIYDIPDGYRVQKVLDAISEFVLEGGGLVIMGCDPVPAGVSEQNAGQPAFEEAFQELLPARPTAEKIQVDAQQYSPLHSKSMAVADWASAPKMEYSISGLRPGAKPYVTDGGASGKPLVVYRKIGKGRALQFLATYPTSKEVADWTLNGKFLDACLLWTGERVLKEDSPEIRLSWLVILSLLVCVVGITNSMLMSVTERIREIGTMKCLGALDGFIVKLFVIESSLHGIFGTMVGVILGFSAAFLLAFFKYSALENAEDAKFNPAEAAPIVACEESLTMQQALTIATSQVAASMAKPLEVTVKRNHYTIRYFPGMPILKRAIAAWCIGAVLSVIAAIYPAYRAAKMQPVDAMRVDE